MFRPSNWHILAFVFASMLVAVGFSYFIAPQKKARIVASEAIEAAQDASLDGSLLEDEQPPYIEASLPGGIVDNRKDFSFEDEEDCRSEGRDYEARDLTAIDPIFRGKRATQPTDFPRSCVTYIMRNYNLVPNAIKGKAVTRNDYGLCPHAHGQPVPTPLPPCITEAYVNTVYNTFGDVMSCLGISAVEFAPKFAQESGFHINALGSHGDAGISQMTEDGIISANEEFDRLKQSALASDSPSCLRIRNSLDKLNKKLPEKLANRCEFLTVPQNPFANIFYGAALHIQNKRLIEHYFTKNEYHVSGQALTIPQMLKRLHGDRLLVQADKRHFHDAESALIYFQEKLKDFLVLMTYNSGPRKPVDLLGNFLKSKILLGQSINLADFDFHVDEATSKAKVKKSGSKANLNFPEFILKYFGKSHGVAAYLIRMAAEADHLDQKIGAGVCVPDPFLRITPRAKTLKKASKDAAGEKTNE